MPRETDSLFLTRRSVLLLAGAGVAFGATGPEFWDKKPPSEWTTEEIDRLITKSPWAKEVNAEYIPHEGGALPGGGAIGMGGLGGRRRGNRSGGTGRGATSSYKGTVRWESAKPILEAMKAPLPEQFANHYVISVNGIPLLSSHSQSTNDGEAPTRRPTQDDPDDNLKQFTTIQPKGKDLAQAGVVHRQVGTGSSFLFGFSSELVPLSKDDSEVLFSTQLGQLTVKTKFSFKEMLYRGALAL
ncbi:MAG TPA: hypothetical protein VKU19_15270 [Bryobacteraceae bacterium]|nr:hypothetical protein [Bryobacteraceae bacterium]